MHQACTNEQVETSLHPARQAALLLSGLLLLAASGCEGDDFQGEAGVGGGGGWGSQEGDDDPENGDDEAPGYLECPPLPPPEGSEVVVSPDDLADLPGMLLDADPNTTFLLQPGTYMLQTTLHVRADGVTLRSSTDVASDVVLDGGYLVGSLVFVNGSDFTIAHLTLKRALHHPIHITPAGEENVTGALVHDVRIFDASQQFMKVNGNFTRTAFVDYGRVECSHFELTDDGRPMIDRSATGCYTGGVDIHGGSGWVVRNNVFRNIYCAGEGLAEHAVHLWSAARDSVVEYNRIYGCARGIGFGLGQTGNVREYEDDPYGDVEGYVGHYDGVIRNNLIVADHPYFDTGIELAQARGARVFHNTVYTVGAGSAFSSIDYRFANTEVTIQNNLVDRITVRDGAKGTVSHNLESIGEEIFVGAEEGDFRLRSSAAEAIDQGIELSDAGRDLQGLERPQGEGPDLGAYEYQPPAEP